MIAGRGQLLEQVSGRSAFRLPERRPRSAGCVTRDGSDADAPCKIGWRLNSVHEAAIALDKLLGSRVTSLAFVRRLAARQYQTRSHPFQVPLKWTADGLVEIVIVENQLAVGSGERSEVLNMSIAAELHVDSRVRQTTRSAAIIDTAPRKKRTASRPSARISAAEGAAGGLPKKR